MQFMQVILLSSHRSEYVCSPNLYWRQVPQYKCTQTGVLLPCTTVQLGQAWCVHHKSQRKGCSSLNLAWIQKCQLKKTIFLYNFLIFEQEHIENKVFTKLKLMNIVWCSRLLEDKHSSQTCISSGCLDSILDSKVDRNSIEKRGLSYSFGRIK